MQHYRNRNASTISNIAPSDVVSLDGIESVKAIVDFACMSGDGGLVLIGWLFDPKRYVQGFALLYEKEKRGLLSKKTYAANTLEHDVDGIQVVHVSRPDVARAMSPSEESQENQYGFVLVIPKFSSDGKIALALKNGQYAILPFVELEGDPEIKRGLELCWEHSGLSLLGAVESAFGDKHPLTQLAAALKDKDEDKHEEEDIDPVLTVSCSEEETPLTFGIDCALRLKKGLILIGWAAADEADVARVTLSGENGWEKEILFRNGDDGSLLSRTFRPDLKKTLSSQGLTRGMRGFVFYGPSDTELPAEVSVNFDGSPEPQCDIPLLATYDGAFPELMRIWLHAGDALTKIASCLGEEPEFASLLEDVELAKASEGSHGFMACDRALLLNNRALVLSGWIAKRPNEIERVELVTDRARIDITSKMDRYVRPDLFEAHPWSNGEAIGFVCVLVDQGALATDIRLKVVCRGSQSQLIAFEAVVANWPALGKFIIDHTSPAEPLLKMLASTDGLEDNPTRLEERIAWLRHGSFLSRHKDLPSMVDRPETVIAAVDHAYALGEAGILIFGWWLTPKRKPESVTIRSAEGDVVDITHRMSAFSRMDVVQNYRQRFPQMNDWCGFVCLAPLPSQPGEARAICFDYGDLGQDWLKVPSKCSEKNDVELIKEILRAVPTTDKLRSVLFEIFDNGLGRAIEAVSRRRTRFSGKIEERVFGRPPQPARVSVIVPLYGRFDFLRHQLAHFADDQDFDSVDLIYVVDDPNIIAPTVDLAAACYQLFEKPFRVVFYRDNLGFAGANNVGVQVSRADTILLLNSDVIPKHPCWLAKLRHALHTLPQAGAVGPLLLFGDDSIQHAGMRPRMDPSLPGFLLNIHPGKGQVWKGTDEPSEHPLLTAACLMLRKQDYLGVGGLDEGYVIGDFEDSDLCLALRKQGKRLWLVPEAKLWHLERQSQNMESIADYRHLLTLFNGWRYHKKIQNGLIADPNQFEVQSCVC